GRGSRIGGSRRRTPRVGTGTACHGGSQECKHEWGLQSRRWKRCRSSPTHSVRCRRFPESQKDLSQREAIPFWSDKAMKIVISGLTISSSWGNGHATLWRGLGRALASRGWQFVFFERDVPYYAGHRD